MTKDNKLLENWQIELKRLDKIRLELGLNWNKMESLTGINRGQLQRFFEFKNCPSMKLYFDVKDALESQMEVFIEEVHRDGGSVIIAPTFPKDRKDFAFSDAYKPIIDKNPKRGVSVIEEVFQRLSEEHGVDSNEEVKSSTFENLRDCDCKIENGLLKRGKIKCTKSKAEHKFD